MGNRYIRRLLYLGAMAPVNPKRHEAPSIEWIPYSSGISSWRAAHRQHRDAEYIAAADLFKESSQNLATQEPSIHGLKPGL
jgi:hypothetical protein